MAISDLYNKTVSTKRLANVTGSNKETWSTNLASLSCAIHPQGQESTELHSGAFYKLFKMWCDKDTDILEGDKVIDADSNTYVVRGVSKFDFHARASSQHLSVTLAQV